MENPKMKNRLVFVVVPLLVALAAVQLAGCGRTVRAKATGRPKVYPVSGVVMYQGRPVEGATITFHRTDGRLSAVGLTDENGRYRLTTYGGFDGAAAGQYQVTVTKHRPAAEAAVSEDDPAYRNPLPNPQPPTPLLPAKYAQTATTDLLATVTAEERNDFPFNLAGPIPPTPSRK
jgi:hypothetical protein